MTPRGGKIRSNLIENLVLDATLAEKKDTSLVNADQVAIVVEMDIEDIEIVLDLAPDPTTDTESGNTEEEVLIAVNAVEAEQNIKKIKAKNAKTINLRRRKKRVRKVVVDLLPCQNHDMHDISQ